MFGFFICSDLAAVCFKAPSAQLIALQQILVGGAIAFAHLESNFSEKCFVVLVETKLSMSQLCAFTTKKTKGIMGYILCKLVTEGGRK